MSSLSLLILNFSFGDCLNLLGLGSLRSVYQLIVLRAVLLAANYYLLCPHMSEREGAPHCLL
jgi:hypothetical protein